MIRFVVDRRRKFLLEETPAGIPEHMVHPTVGPFLDPRLIEEKDTMIKDLKRVLGFENNRQVLPEINKAIHHYYFY